MGSQHRNKSTVYHLQAEHDGLTVAAALKAVVEAASWNQAKKWVSGRHIQVNGNLCLDPARRVKAKDVIKLFGEPQHKPIESRDIKLAYLDDHLLVVEKPAGITSVRHFNERKLSTKRRQLQPTLDEMLPAILAKKLHLRWPPLPPEGMNRGRHANNQRRRGQFDSVQNAKKLPPEYQVIAVHRLDRDTSGLMLFARFPQVAQRLVSMFRRHTVQREYVAFCQGLIEPQTIRSTLVRDRGDGNRGSLPPDVDASTLEEGPSPQNAITHIVATKALQGGSYSKIRCKLETGRTHQIRIHLAELGSPICGDKIYHRLGDGTVLEDRSNAPRQALHSDALEFTHPVTGQHLQFRMPLPKDLVAWLKVLDPSPGSDSIDEDEPPAA